MEDTVEKWWDAITQRSEEKPGQEASSLEITLKPRRTRRPQGIQGINYVSIDGTSTPALLDGSR